jgi:RimJ/RimL family protein N-acetyltransferase
MTPSLARVEGPNLALRFVQSDDAEYLHRLRIDPAYNSHLSAVRGTADDQRRWIDAYKAREADGSERYYIIERRDGTPCGTVRLYDIKDDSFTWGSWILDHNKPRKAALESAVLSFDVGFKSLGKDRGFVDVRIGNTHAEGFYRRLGMTETHRTDQDIFFVYPRARFDADRAGYLTILEKEAGA